MPGQEMMTRNSAIHRKVIDVCFTIDPSRSQESAQNKNIACVIFHSQDSAVLLQERLKERLHDHNQVTEVSFG